MIAALGLLAGLGAGACDGGGDARYAVPRIPELRSPPPLPAAARSPSVGEYRLLVEALRARTTTDLRIHLPRAEATLDLAGLIARSDGAPVLRASEVRATRPAISIPPDTVVTGLDFFFPLFDAGLIIERLVVDDGAVGTRAVAAQRVGDWLWRVVGVDMLATDVRLGEAVGAEEGFRIARLSGAGEFRARPFRIDAASLTARRGAALLTVRADLDLGRSRVRADGRIDPSNAWAIDIDAAPADFAELRAFLPALPETGTGTGGIAIRGQNGRATYTFDRFAAAVGESLARIDGTIAAAPEPALTDLTARLAPVYARDVEAAAGIDLPFGGRFTGTLRADGGFRAGIAVGGDIEHREDAGPPSRIGLRGQVRIEPEPAVALDVTANPLRIADTTVTAALFAEGPLDSVRIRGNIATIGREPVLATVDARLRDQPGAPPLLAGDARLTSVRRRRADARLPAADTAGLPVQALATGSAVLAEGGALDVRVRTDRLPLAGLPVPEPIHDVRGTAAGRLDVAGTVDSPVVGGRFRIRDAGFRFSPDAPPVRGVSGTIDIRDGVLVTDRLAGRVDGGTFEVAGRADAFRDAGRLALDVRLDSVPLDAAPLPPEIDSVRGAVSGRATVAGTIDEPVAEGRFRVGHGGLRLRTLGLAVDSLEGPLRLEDDVLRTTGLTARAGGGELALAGRVRIAGERNVDLTLDMDSVRAVDMDSARAVVSGRLALAGPIAEPRLAGELRLLDGWVYEDVFRPSPVLDVESPPYAELAARVPWPADSRLRRAGPGEPPPVRGSMRVVITPGFSVIDEDSEMFGHGEMLVRLDDDVSVEGGLRVEGGFYAFFGERFRIVGGAVDFDGPGLEPRIGLIAEHSEPPALGRSRGSDGSLVDRFPPLEFTALGPAATPVERIRRASIFPETQSDLAGLLIYNVEPMPATGWRQALYWRETQIGEVIGERAESQAVPLAWSYIADEAYDYLPLSIGYLQAGTIEVGPRDPARIVVGPLLRAAAVLGDGEAIVSQPLDGDMLVGIRGRWRIGGGRGFIEAFSEPRFYAAPIAGAGHPGFFDRRRLGIGAGWEWRF